MKIKDNRISAVRLRIVIIIINTASGFSISNDFIDVLDLVEVNRGNVIEENIRDI